MHRQSNVAPDARAPFTADMQSKMMKQTPVEFFRDVRREMTKVTWPSRKETVVTTSMVFVMVILSALFFLVVDQVMSFGVRQILGLGS